LHLGGTESIILVVALGKGLVNTFIANGVLGVISSDVAILGVLVVFVIVALSKGLVIAVNASGIHIFPSLYFFMVHILAR
jgi:hypothetical protein